MIDNLNLSYLVCRKGENHARLIYSCRTVVICISGEYTLWIFKGIFQEIYFFLVFSCSSAYLPIPLVVYLRHLAGFGWRVIPFTLGGAVAGQIVGGWYKRRIRHGRKTTKRQP